MDDEMPVDIERESEKKPMKKEGFKLINKLLLPELINDLDHESIDNEYFQEFRDNLQLHLKPLYDLVQEEHSHIFDPATSETIQTRCNFILLICEQTSSNTLFQVEDALIIEYIHPLAKNFFNKILDEDERVEAKVLDYYKSRLTSDKWKKQLGAAHGFPRFLQMRYGSQNRKIPNDLCTFILSVGLSLRDFYNPTYKNLSYQITLIMLKNSDTKYLRRMNIPNVIFDAYLKDLLNIKSLDVIQNLLECLLSCVELTESNVSFKFSKLDHLIENIIKGITFTSIADFREYFFKFLWKLSITSAEDKHEIMLFLDQQKLDEARNMCKESTHTASYRWAKKILELFISEANHLTEDYERCCALLKYMHHCYLTCILPIPIHIVQIHLEKFLPRFTSVLCVTYRCFYNRPELKEIIVDFLQTFLYHIDKTNNNVVSAYKISCLKIINDGIL